MRVEINPKIDFAFRSLFGNPARQELLLSLMNSVLVRTLPQPVTEIEIINPYVLGEQLGDKESILDIKARDPQGRVYNIEMQMVATPIYNNRAVYYATQVLREQLGTGDNYNLLRPTISISFLNTIQEPSVADYHTFYHLISPVYPHIVFSDLLQFHLIELPKFTQPITEIDSPIERWCYFLRHVEGMDTESIPKPMQDPLIQQAMEVLVKMGQNPQERELYDRQRKAILDRNSIAIDSRNRGIAEGKIEGKVETIISTIRSIERLLSVEPATPGLESMSLDQLTELQTNLLVRLSKNAPK